MYKARKSQRKDEPIETNLSWLLSKSGQEFVTKAVWRFGQPSFRLTQVMTQLSYIKTHSLFFLVIWSCCHIFLAQNNLEVSVQKCLWNWIGSVLPDGGLKIFSSWFDLQRCPTTVKNSNKINQRLNVRCRPQEPWTHSIWLAATTARRSSRRLLPSSCPQDRPLVKSARLWTSSRILRRATRLSEKCPTAKIRFACQLLFFSHRISVVIYSCTPVSKP